MVRMETGDQTPTDAESGQTEPVEAVESGPVLCSCKWRTMDTGNSFYSRIIKADPECKVHPNGRGW